MDRHGSVQRRCSATDQVVAVVNRESPVMLLRDCHMEHGEAPSRGSCPSNTGCGGVVGPQRHGRCRTPTTVGKHARAEVCSLPAPPCPRDSRLARGDGRWRDVRSSSVSQISKDVDPRARRLTGTNRCSASPHRLHPEGLTLLLLGPRAGHWLPVCCGHPSWRVHTRAVPPRIRRCKMRCVRDLWAPTIVLIAVVGREGHGLAGPQQVSQIRDSSIRRS